MAKVSILMNCYNCRKYLKKAIDSVYAQVFQDWEIIFIDNCSTDNSKKLLLDYDDKIKYYKIGKNIPLGSARNIGLMHCNGDYIAFLDTDDIWLPDKLEIQIKVMDDNLDYQVCYGGVIYIDKDDNYIKKILPKARSGNVFAQQLVKFEINMLSSIVRNNIKLKFNENMQFSPDFDTFMNLAASYNIFVIKKYLVKYRVLNDSLTSQKMDRWWKETKYTVDNLYYLRSKYRYGFKLIYAKIAYYKARYLISKRNKKLAIIELSKYKFTSIMYFSIYLLSLLPYRFWNFIHRNK